MQTRYDVIVVGAGSAGHHAPSKRHSTAPKRSPSIRATTSAGRCTSPAGTSAPPAPGARPNVASRTNSRRPRWTGWRTTGSSSQRVPRVSSMVTSRMTCPGPTTPPKPAGRSSTCSVGWSPTRSYSPPVVSAPRSRPPGGSRVHLWSPRPTHPSAYLPTFAAGRLPASAVRDPRRRPDVLDGPRGRGGSVVRTDRDRMGPGRVAHAGERAGHRAALQRCGRHRGRRRLRTGAPAGPDRRTALRCRPGPRAHASSGSSFCEGMILAPALAFGRLLGQRIGFMTQTEVFG